MTNIDSRISLSIESGVATLTIEHPKKLNALDSSMIDSLGLAVSEIERSSARVAIITGSDKSFSVGGDVSDWGKYSEHEFGMRWVRDGHTVFDSLARLSVPLIAVLNGHTLGGGLELAACADIRIAESDTGIGSPETGLGIIPGWSGTQRSVRRFGSGTVRRMVLFGEIFSADEALSLGIVDYVVPSGEGMMKARELSEQVMSLSGRAVELSKMLLNAAEGEERERVLESLAGSVASGSPELSEGLSAFAKKRRPKFKK